jgi:hypothetical protein
MCAATHRAVSSPSDGTWIPPSARTKQIHYIRVFKIFSHSEAKRNTYHFEKLKCFCKKERKNKSSQKICTAVRHMDISAYDTIRIKQTIKNDCKLNTC